MEFKEEIQKIKDVFSNPDKRFVDLYLSRILQKAYDEGYDEAYDAIF